MTRRSLAAEGRDEATCLRFNVLTGQKVSPDPTRQQARHSEWNDSEHLLSQKLETNRRNQKPLLQNDQERTNRNPTGTMEGPETTSITPLAL